MTNRGFSSIASCTKLAELCLYTAGERLELSAADWQAIGELTQLAALVVKGFLAPDAEQRGWLYVALRNLTRLEHVYWSEGWTPAALPILAALPSLRSINGAWQGVDAAVPLTDTQCSSVIALGSLSGRTLPFGAFPSLLRVKIILSMDAASWQALGSSCPRLQQIERAWSLKKQSAFASLSSAADDASRAAALRSLSQLTALTKLVFFPARRYELAALAAFLPPQLQQLELACHGDMEGGCWGALVALGKLTSLRALTVVVWELLEDPVQVQLFLSAVSHVPEVRVAGMGERMSEVLAGHHGVGLQLPAKLTIKQLPADGW
jgi:hypothetical protein